MSSPLSQINLNDLPLIVILGPTASGKTGYAIDLAAKIGGEIICADSRTVYIGMDIGTAKPTLAEQKGVPHWGLNLVEPNQRFSLYDFQSYAVEKIAQIRSRGHVPLLVGGSGLYIDSIIYNYQLQADDVDIEHRQQLEKLSTDELVQIIDEQGGIRPADVHNRRRLIRAIEAGGVNKNDIQMIANTVVIGITTPREQLNQRITDRAKNMFNSGLIDEVSGLLAKYGSVEPLRRNAYGVVANYLDGQYSLDEALEKFITSDRHLVKKQLTWWRSPRRHHDIHWRSLSELLVELPSVK